MGTLLQTLHVLAAVLLIGPLVYAPLHARRGIADRDASHLRSAARQTALFGVGSGVVALFGALTLAVSDEYGFATPWVVISITLYVIALGLIYLLALPALRTSARLLEQGQGVLSSAPGHVPATDAESAAAAPALTATADDLRAKEQLDATTVRVTLAGVLIALAFAAIVVLMVVRPFQA